jgi:hypothetical protein
VAVAFHHHSRGNAIGCRSLLELAIRNLGLYPPQYAGLGLALLLQDLAQWRTALDDGSTLPAFPQVKRQK